MASTKRLRDEVFEEESGLKRRHAPRLPWEPAPVLYLSAQNQVGNSLDNLKSELRRVKSVVSCFSAEVVRLGAHLSHVENHLPVYEDHRAEMDERMSLVSEVVATAEESLGSIKSCLSDLRILLVCKRVFYSDKLSSISVLLEDVREIPPECLNHLASADAYLDGIFDRLEELENQLDEPTWNPRRISKAFGVVYRYINGLGLHLVDMTAQVTAWDERLKSIRTMLSEMA